MHPRRSRALATPTHVLLALSVRRRRALRRRSHLLSANKREVYKSRRIRHPFPSPTYIACSPPPRLKNLDVVASPHQSSLNIALLAVKCNLKQSTSHSFGGYGTVRTSIPPCVLLHVSSYLFPIAQSTYWQRCVYSLVLLSVHLRTP